jgi:hypothetical protein
VAIGSAFADRKRAGRPGFRDETRPRNGQRQGKHKQRAALRSNRRYDQKPLPSPATRNLSERPLRLGEREFENGDVRMKYDLFLRRHGESRNPDLGRSGRSAALKRDEFRMNRHRALALCLGMIFSENRFTLFRIML